VTILLGARTARARVITPVCMGAFVWENRALNDPFAPEEAPLQQTNTDPVTDALYTVNFAALGPTARTSSAPPTSFCRRTAKRT
jgi:hypothetical protein